MKIKELSILLLIVILASCNTSKKDNKTQLVSLRQAWFPWAGYLGEVVSLNETDSLFGINLKLDQGADDIDPIKLVIGGNNDFGVASAETVIDAISKGAGLKIVGIINFKSPTCFISLDTSIKTFRDFDGKTIGILTATETETIYKLLLIRGIINKEKVKEVEVPFDLSSFIVSKAYDIRPAYVYDEPITLEKMGIKYSIIVPSSNNISIVSGVYFTSDKLIYESPKTVQAFVNAIALGWHRAITNPSKAIEYLKKYDAAIDTDRELKSFLLGIDYFRGEDNKVLWASDETLTNTLNILVELGRIKTKESISKYFNLSFVDQYNKGKVEGNSK